MKTNEMNLETFVEDLLTEKQFQNLDAEVYDQLKLDLMSRASDVINAALMRQLSETNLKKLEELVDSGAPVETTQAFIAENVQDLPQIVAGTLLRFRNSYIGQA